MLLRKQIVLADKFFEPRTYSQISKCNGYCGSFLFVTICIYSPSIVRGKSTCPSREFCLVSHAKRARP